MNRNYSYCTYRNSAPLCGKFFLSSEHSPPRNLPTTPHRPSLLLTSISSLNRMILEFNAYSAAVFKNKIMSRAYLYLVSCTAIQDHEQSESVLRSRLFTSIHELPCYAVHSTGGCFGVPVVVARPWLPPLPCLTRHSHTRPLHCPMLIGADTHTRPTGPQCFFSCHALALRLSRLLLCARDVHKVRGDVQHRHTKRHTIAVHVHALRRGRRLSCRACHSHNRIAITRTRAHTHTSLPRRRAFQFECESLLSIDASFPA